MIKILTIILGAALSLIGLLGVGFGVLSMLDPVGAQLADDHNSLAKAPALAESGWVTIIYGVVLLFGLWLLFASLRKRNKLLNKSLTITRNDPCWCGSGKKYKRCHLPSDEAEKKDSFLSASIKARNEENAVTGRASMANRGFRKWATWRNKDS